MSKFLRFTAIVVTLLYPFGVYFGLQYFNPRTLVLLLIIILGVRSFTLQKSPINHWLWLPLILILVLWTWLGDTDIGLKFYPVMVNVSLFVLFCWSLIYPPSMIERFAKIQDPDLPERGVKYTRRVTQFWAVFFVFNASASFVTSVWMSDEAWALYNGFISYVLMGLIFAIEWLIRQRVMQANHD